MLLTRSPLSASIATNLTFDLHVLGTPPAFILSQDQTLRKFTEFTNSTEDSSPILSVSCSLSFKSISVSLLSIDSSSLLSSWRCPQNHPPGRSLSQTPQQIAPQTTAGFLSYHSSVVNVPPVTASRTISYTPGHSCQPQGTSPNFTTPPLPCQIRQALFLTLFRSNLQPHFLRNRHFQLLITKPAKPLTKVTGDNHTSYHSLDPSRKSPTNRDSSTPKNCR